MPGTTENSDWKIGTDIKCVPVPGTDTITTDGVSKNVSTRYHSITMMAQYRNKSFDELRLEDLHLQKYHEGMQHDLVRKEPSASVFGHPTRSTGFVIGPSAVGSTGPSAFGSSSTSAANNSFVKPSNNSGYGTSTSFPYDSSIPSSGTSRMTNFSAALRSSEFTPIRNQDTPQGSFNTPSIASFVSQPVNSIGLFEASTSSRDGPPIPTFGWNNSSAANTNNTKSNVILQLDNNPTFGVVTGTFTLPSTTSVSSFGINNLNTIPTDFGLGSLPNSPCNPGTGFKPPNSSSAKNVSGSNYLQNFSFSDHSAGALRGPYNVGATFGRSQQTAHRGIQGIAFDGIPANSRTLPIEFGSNNLNTASSAFGCGISTATDSLNSTPDFNSAVFGTAMNRLGLPDPNNRQTNLYSSKPTLPPNFGVYSQFNQDGQRYTCRRNLNSALNAIGSNLAKNESPYPNTKFKTTNPNIATIEFGPFGLDNCPTTLFNNKLTPNFTIFKQSPEADQQSSQSGNNNTGNVGASDCVMSYTALSKNTGLSSANPPNAITIPQPSATVSNKGINSNSSCMPPNQHNPLSCTPSDIVTKPNKSKPESSSETTSGSTNESTHQNPRKMQNASVIETPAGKFVIKREFKIVKDQNNSNILPTDSASVFSVQVETNSASNNNVDTTVRLVKVVPINNPTNCNKRWTLYVLNVEKTISEIVVTDNNITGSRVDENSANLKTSDGDKEEIKTKDENKFANKDKAQNDNIAEESTLNNLGLDSTNNDSDTLEPTVYVRANIPASSSKNHDNIAIKSSLDCSKPNSAVVKDNNIVDELMDINDRKSSDQPNTAKNTQKYDIKLRKGNLDLLFMSITVGLMIAIIYFINRLIIRYMFSNRWLLIETIITGYDKMITSMMDATTSIADFYSGSDLMIYITIAVTSTSLIFVSGLLNHNYAESYKMSYTIWGIVVIMIIAFEFLRYNHEVEESTDPELLTFIK